MSNGWGTVFLIILGLILMIAGLILIVSSSMITSEEGLNVSLNETTPEGRAVDLMQSSTFWMGVVLIILGITIMIISPFLV